MPWVVEDVVGPKEFEQRSIAGNGIGDLKNPDFPEKVGPNESWSGTIDVANTGDEVHTFRVSRNGKVKTTFDLPPGETRTVTFEGVGPETFTITLERKVKKGFLEEHKKEIIIGSMVAGAVGLGYVATR